MANFNELWGADNPSDSTNANEIDDYENNLRTMLAERVQDMIYGFTSGEDTDAPGFKYLTMKQQTSDPTTLADQVSLYVKDSTGACVYARPESAGTAVKILDAACQVPAGAYAADSIDEDDIQLSNTGMLQGEVAATGSSADIIGLNASDVPVLADGAVLAEATEAADGDRTIADKKYVDDQLATSEDNIVILTDEKAQNTDGGTFTSGAWQKRTVTEKSDTKDLCSVSSSVIVLSAGTYECDIVCPGYRCNNHQARLQNTTAASTLVLGSAADSASSAGYAQTLSHIKGIFTVAASQDLEIQHRCGTTRSTDGFGTAANFGTEVYTIARFRKI